MLPLPIALLWILGSTILFTGSSYSLMKFILRKDFQFFQKGTYYASKIIQTGPHRDHLSSRFLAEILDLSIDKPTKLSALDCKMAAEKLKSLPMIKEAKVKTIRPDIVYIDYVMRTPIAFLYDIQNAALDEYGCAFPFSPFYSPKQLPEIFLGLEVASADCFHRQIQGKKLDLAFDVLSMLKKIAFSWGFVIKRIDVSKAFEKSLGKKEIVLQLESKQHELYTMSKSHFSHILRINPENYAKSLGNYLILHKELMMEEGFYDYSFKKEDRVIDLRLENLAYIEETSFK